MCMKNVFRLRLLLWKGYVFDANFQTEFETTIFPDLFCQLQQPLFGVVYSTSFKPMPYLFINISC